MTTEIAILMSALVALLVGLVAISWCIKQVSEIVSKLVWLYEKLSGGAAR